MLPETKELIQGINQKDEKAWKVLFKSFYAPLCHYSSRILADEQVVPDIVQNTLVNLWNSSVRFENGKALTVYLYRAVWNNALKYLRDRNVEEERLKHWFEEEGEMSEENFYSVVREELFRKLRELIDRLPEERKKIMLMSLEGKSGEEIACDLNITYIRSNNKNTGLINFFGSNWDNILLCCLFSFSDKKYRKIQRNEG